MPLTTKGKKIKAAMTKKYGEKKGEDIFYASAQKGTIEGVAKGKKLAKGGAVRKTSKPKKSKTKSKSRVNEAGNYTKPALEKDYLKKLNLVVRAVSPDNGQHVRHRCWHVNIKQLAVDINSD